MKVPEIRIRRIGMIVFIIMNTGLLIARDILQISFPKEVFIVIEALFMLIADANEMIEMLCFLFPLMCGLPASYIMPVAMVLYIAKRRSLNRLQLLGILVFSSLEVLAFIRYKGAYYNELIGYISHISVFFLMLFDEEIDSKKCIQYFVIGTTVCLSIIMLVSFTHTSPDWIDLLSKGWFRIGRYYTDEGMHITLNSNTVSFYSAIAIMLAISLLATTRRMKILNIICICILSVAALFALSRTWFIVIAVFLLSLCWKKKKSIRSFAVMVCAVLLTFLIGFIILSKFPALYKGLVARFTKQDGTNDRRVELVFLYLSALLEHPVSFIGGAGVINPNEILGISDSLSMHTSVVQLFVCYGIFGFIVFMFLWGKAITKRYNDGKENGYQKSVQIATFLGCILYSLTVQMINPYYNMFPYLMATLSLSLQKE